MTSLYKYANEKDEDLFVDLLGSIYDIFRPIITEVTEDEQHLVFERRTAENSTLTFLSYQTDEDCGYVDEEPGGFEIITALPKKLNDEHDFIEIMYVLPEQAFSMRPLIDNNYDTYLEDVEAGLRTIYKWAFHEPSKVAKKIRKEFQGRDITIDDRFRLILADIKLKLKRLDNPKYKDIIKKLGDDPQSIGVFISLTFDVIDEEEYLPEIGEKYKEAQKHFAGE